MDEVNIVLGALAAVAAAAVSIVFWKRQNIAAHLSPVRRELKKEKDTRPDGQMELDFREPQKKKRPRKKEWW